MVVPGSIDAGGSPRPAAPALATPVKPRSAVNPPSLQTAFHHIGSNLVDCWWGAVCDSPRECDPNLPFTRHSAGELRRGQRMTYRRPWRQQWTDWWQSGRCCAARRTLALLLLWHYWSRVGRLRRTSGSHRDNRLSVAVDTTCQLLDLPREFIVHPAALRSGRGNVDASDATDSAEVWEQRNGSRV